MTIQAIITQLATVEAAIDGVVAAYDETPESLNEFPCFINYPVSGTYRCGSGTMKAGIQTIGAELHVTREVLPEAEAVARPFIDLFTDAIFEDIQLDSNCVAVTEIRWEYGQLKFANETHLGVKFLLDVSVRETVS